MILLHSIDEITEVAFSPNGKYIATVSRKRKLYVTDVRLKKLIRVLDKIHKCKEIIYNIYYNKVVVVLKFIDSLNIIN